MLPTESKESGNLGYSEFWETWRNQVRRLKEQEIIAKDVIKV